MAFELREGQGTLFPNNKDGNDKRPDYRGSVMIGGTEYELAAWSKEGKKGPYLSLSAKVKPAAETSDSVRKASSQADDDVPF